MDRLWGSVELVAGSDSTVLVLGETGTGKTVLAKWLHLMSARASAPFVVADCAGRNPHLIESALFGHERGAFTGAVEQQIGYVERAGGGTLFLDEIGDLDQETQKRLLRLLEERTFERVGGSKTLRSDARIIAATNHDIGELVRAGRLREDLFFRIDVVRIEMPPLRDRRDDWPRLVHVLVREICDKTGSAMPTIAPAITSEIDSRDWPGNIRELRNAVERAVLACDGKLSSLGLASRLVEGSANDPVQLEQLFVNRSLDEWRALLATPVDDLVEAFRGYLVLGALTATDDNVSRAAELSRMSRSTLLRHARQAGWQSTRDRTPRLTRETGAPRERRRRASRTYCSSTTTRCF